MKAHEQSSRRALTPAASTLPPIHHLPSSADTNSRAPRPTHEQISPPGLPPPNPPTFNSSAALTLLVLLSALFFLGFFSLYIRRFIAGGESSSTTTTTTVIFSRPTSTSLPRRSIQPKGLDAATVESMPCFAYGGGWKYETSDCSVCLSDFEEGESVKVLPPCEHLFHAQCIDRWLYSHPSCPVCRSTSHQKL